MDQPASTASLSGPARWTSESQGRWQWVFRTDLSATARAFLREPSWTAWLEHPAVTVIKPARRRTVLRISPTAEVPAVYCKHFLNGGIADRLRTVLRGAPAAWEAGRIELALSRGLPTAAVLGYGVRRRGPLVVESRLFLSAIEPTVSLADLCSPAEVPEMILPDAPDLPRTVWVPAVARLLAQLHGRGLWHGDLHGGNILLQVSPTGCQPWLIDLAALRGGTRSPRSQLISNLARVWLSIERAWTSTDRANFIRHYWERLRDFDPALADSLGTTVELATQELQQATATALRSIHRRADQAWERGGRRVVMLPRGRALKALGEPWIQEAAARIEQGWLQADVASTWPGGSVRRWSTATPFGMRTLRLIRFAKSRRGHLWSPARTAWEWGHALHRRGITVAIPWLLLEGDQADLLLASEPEGTRPLLHTPVLVDRLETLLRQIADAGFSWSTISEEAVRQSADGQTVAWCALELLQRRPAADLEHEIRICTTRLMSAATADKSE